MSIKSSMSLETELRKISADGDELNPSELAKATMVLNNKIKKRCHSVRNSLLSWLSWQFQPSHVWQRSPESLTRATDWESRTWYNFKQIKKCAYSSSHCLSRRSRIMKNNHSKHTSKDLHLVIGSDAGGKMILRKAIHASPFAPRSTVISPCTKLVDTKFIAKPS